MLLRNRAERPIFLSSATILPPAGAPAGLRRPPSRPAMPDAKPVQTARAPGAIGPYSQAVVVEGWIYASGQIPLDPDTGALVQGGAAAQTDRVLANLAAVLEAAGGSLATVVKTTVFLSDMALFGEMNGAYERGFGVHKPARSTVAVKGLPKGVDVEIDVVARVR